MTQLSPPQSLPPRHTFVYKLVDDCEIKADVFGIEPRSRKPAVIWIHGGGLIFGTRASPRPGLVAALAAAGAVVVSIDHRLAPETKLPDIVDDIRDAWHWVRARGSESLGIDPSRVAIAGSSAGGYLSLMSGYALQPRPRALVSFFGFGDITLDWEAKPSAHYRQFPLVTPEAAWRNVGQTAIAEPPADRDRSEFYLYCRQQGRWLEHVVGRDPEREPRWFDAYCPVRNLTEDFPPTLLIHGTEDTDVPADESKNMAAALARANVTHELLLLDGVGHGFGGATPDQVAAAERRVADFLMARLR
jgi:acetyl esterase/lipase